MSQNARHHLAPATTPASDLEPKELSRLEFGRRLSKLMLDRGWNQSELARRAGLGRDAISTYVRGRSLPEPKSLKALSDALSISTDALFPNSVMMAMDADTSPRMEIKEAAGHPGMAFIRVNRMLSIPTIAKIFSLIMEDDQSREKGAK